jgi:hypothetical protein
MRRQLPRRTEEGRSPAPSIDPLLSIDTVLQLVSDERLLAAHRVLCELDPAAVRAASSADPQLAAKLARVRSRAAACHRALEEFKSDDGSAEAAAAAGIPPWRFGQEYFGITTHYRQGGTPLPGGKGATDGPPGSLWIRMQGVVRGIDLFSALSVIRELSLFRSWAPFCDLSDELALLGRCELICHIGLKVPLARRDAVLHAFGADLTREHGCILLLARSTTAEEFPDAGIPPPPPPRTMPWSPARLEISAFKCKIEPLSRTEARFTIVNNADPKAPLPQSFVNFVTRKVCGILLYKLQQRVLHVSRSPGCEHRVRIMEDPVRFYSWLRPRVEALVDVLEGGEWDAGPETRCRKPQRFGGAEEEEEEAEEEEEEQEMGGGRQPGGGGSGGGGSGGGGARQRRFRSKSPAATARCPAVGVAAAAAVAAAPGGSRSVGAAGTAAATAFWFACTVLLGATCLYQVLAAVLRPSSGGGGGGGGAGSTHGTQPPPHSSLPPPPPPPLPPVGSTYELRGNHSIVHHGLGGGLRKVHAIGDLHGDAFCARKWVEHTGLVDLGEYELNCTVRGDAGSGGGGSGGDCGASTMRWLEPSSVLLFLGDYLDRGPTGVQIVWLVRALCSRFPEHVVALLGNHELYMLLDAAKPPAQRYAQMLLSFVHPAELAAAGAAAAASEAANRTAVAAVAAAAAAAGTSNGTEADDAVEAAARAAAIAEELRREEDAESLALVFETLQRLRAKGYLPQGKYTAQPSLASAVEPASKRAQVGYCPTSTFSYFLLTRDSFPTRFHSHFSTCCAARAGGRGAAALDGGVQRAVRARGRHGRVAAPPARRELRRGDAVRARGHLAEGARAAQHHEPGAAGGGESGVPRRDAGDVRECRAQRGPRRAVGDGPGQLPRHARRLRGRRGGGAPAAAPGGAARGAGAHRVLHRARHVRRQAAGGGLAAWALHPPVRQRVLPRRPRHARGAGQRVPPRAGRQVPRADGRDREGERRGGRRRRRRRGVGCQPERYGGLALPPRLSRGQLPGG